MANYLVTGAAGFIGSRVAEMLLEDGHSVLGVDNLNDAYDVRMKNWRLNNLQKEERFKFKKLDISNKAGLEELVSVEARAAPATGSSWLRRDHQPGGPSRRTPIRPKSLGLCRHEYDRHP